MELILYPMRKNKVNLKNYFDINAEQTTNFNKVAYHLAVLVFVEAEKWAHVEATSHFFLCSNT